MKAVFMGTPEFAVPTLQALIDHHEVLAVVTQPDKQRGRGKKMQFPPVKEKAVEYDIPVYQPQRARDEEFIEELKNLNPDVIVVVAYGQILPESILNIPKYGCINVHGSLLPKYRGAAPIQWAVLDGEEKTGITTMYMEKGLVSVITPTYNCAKFIGETIESVQAQTYQQWEMIIVDDCSTDNTKEIVDKYIKEDSRIKYFCLENNSGAAVARTKAMELANGEYMAFLDSDDIWPEEKLKKQLAFMKKHDVAFSCTAYEQIDENGKVLNKIIKTVPKADYNRVLLDCPVGNSTVMYNVEKMGKFEVPNIRKRNDDALWLQMLKKEKYIYGMRSVLMKYRIRQNSISSNKFKVIKYHWILYRDIEHLSIARSVFHIAYWCVIKLLKIK